MDQNLEVLTDAMDVQIEIGCCYTALAVVI